MKFRVTVNGELFEVEIEDSRARPVVASVDGVRYEVEVEESAAVVSAPAPTVGSVQPAPVAVNRPSAAPSAPVDSDTRRVLAPMPGVIVEVMVGPGELVEPRQPLIVLESMKMKNVIRATRAGQIETVHVSNGQSVKHRDVLVTYGR